MTVFYFILAAIALGVLVFFHELGHYFVAKKLGMTVETFSIGFGKPILKWRWNDVSWQLGWLPFGGYVKILGMEFGKKEKDGTYTEPYDIPNGFFSKPPYQRILVALAGPVANFIVAFILFVMIWAMGGREKQFAEYTQIVGWVEPKSELYALGLRPGDLLTHYNGKPFTGSRDLLYATMLGGKEVELKGYHLDYTTGEKTPFNYKIESYPATNAIDGILTTGVSASARYLIFDHIAGGLPNVLPEGSPMEGSGIAYQDRVVWADGEYLFSMDQLSNLINDRFSLLTVKRGNEVFLTRQPRVLAGDLLIPPFVRDELQDWLYASKVHGKWQETWLLPYVINSEGYVEGPLDFIDQESRIEAFPVHPYRESLSTPLQPGDLILAVDGTSVQRGYELLSLLQTHQVQIVVEHNVPVDTKISWKQEDTVFEKGVDLQAIRALVSTIGTKEEGPTRSRYSLLKPVEPKRLDQFSLSTESREKIAAEYARQKEEIGKIRDKEKRAQALQYLQESHQKRMLGIYLQDRKVDYNPGPGTLFWSVFGETWQTLKALVTGYLHPKWISGPVGIVQVIHHGWKVGIGEAFFWIGAISLNLGVLNLLPIPVLDGGYICLALWEWITKRRLKAKTMERLIIPFVVLLIGLLIFLTFQDVLRLF